MVFKRRDILKYLVILVIIVSCVTLTNKTIDKKLLIKETVIEFQELFPEVNVLNARIDVSDYTTTVQEPTGKTRLAHGICFYSDKRIIIGKRFLETGNIYQIKKVIFHELGHCYLGLRHPQEDKFEYTIMNIILDTALTDGSNWGYLKGELRLRYIRKKHK